MSEGALNQLDKKITDWPVGQTAVTPGNIERGENDGEPFELVIEEGEQLQNWVVEQRVDSLRIRNPWGFEAIEIPFALSSRATSDIIGTARAVNNLIMLEMGSEIVAIDTLSEDNMASTIRWRYPLDGSSVDNFRGLSSARGESTERTIWGEVRRRNTKETALVGASAAGVFVRRNDELICLDLLTSDRVWTRRGMAKDFQMFRVKNELVCLEPQLGFYSIIDARNGVLLDRRELPAGYEFKCGNGDLILSDKKLTDRRGEMRLWNWRTGQMLLNQTFESGTVASVCEGGRHLVVWEPSGTMTFWDLYTGSEWKHQLRPESRLQEIRVASFGDRYLILPNSLQYRAGVTLTGTERLVKLRMVRGPIMAIDAKDGKPLWDRSPVVYDYYFPWLQCRTSPVVTFLRRLSWKVTEPKFGNREFVGLAFLDIRTGQTLFESNTLLPMRGLGFSQTVQLDEDRCHIEYSGVSFDLNFSSQEQPPFPIADIGNLQGEDMRFLMSDPLLQQKIDQLFEMENGPGAPGFNAPMMVPKKPR